MKGIKMETIDLRDALFVLKKLRESGDLESSVTKVGFLNRPIRALASYFGKNTVVLFKESKNADDLIVGIPYPIEELLRPERQSLNFTRCSIVGVSKNFVTEILL